MSRWLRIAIRVVLLVGIAVGLWWFVHKMDVAALGRAFSDAKLWPLVLAAALNFVCLGGKAVCWRLMLAPRYRVKVSRLFRYTIATFAASAIAPARAGEVLRLWVLERRDGVPVAYTTAVAVSEKLLDGITILLLTAPVMWLVPGLPSWVASAVAVCAAVAIGLFIGLFIAVGRVEHDQHTDEASRSLVRRFLIGLHVLRSPQRLLGSLGILLVVWTTDLWMAVAVLYAVDIHISIAGAMLTLFTLNLAIALPSTPAQVGALEGGAVAGLVLLQVDKEAALAFALLYHVVQVVPVIAAGLLLELRLVLGRTDERPVAAAGAGAPAGELTGTAASPRKSGC